MAIGVGGTIPFMAMLGERFPGRLAAVFLGIFAMSAAPAEAGPDEETLGSCREAQIDLPKFSTPEKTWTYFVQSLRAGDRKAALKALLAGPLKNALSSLFDSTGPDKMREMADSFGPLSNPTDLGNLREYLVVRNLGTKSVGATVEFEYHADCGGWRIASM